MSRLDTMLERLPAPLAIDPGSRLREVLGVVAAELAALDEDRDRIQRSHWVDHAFERDDLAGLGALFAVVPAAWEPLGLFRTRLKATVAALLRGSVTRSTLTTVLTEIVAGGQAALSSRYIDPAARLELSELPPRTRRSDDLLARRGLLRPHDRFLATNRGADAVPLAAAIVGVAGGRTVMPVIVNHTTGAALGWRGLVPAGEVLVVRGAGTAQEGSVTATLDGEDVSAGLWSTSTFGPERLVDEPTRPLVLARGDNDLAFVSLARYDEPGLDAAMLGLAGSAQVQGRFAGGGDDGTVFGDAVFAQDPVVGLDAWWVERTPAAFRVTVPAGVVRRVARRRDDPEQDRDDLFRLLSGTTDRLRAAAVDGQTVPALLSDQQRAVDRVTVLGALPEAASPGDGQVVAVDAAFDVTPRDRSRYSS